MPKPKLRASLSDWFGFRYAGPIAAIIIVAVGLVWAINGNGGKAKNPQPPKVAHTSKPPGSPSAKTDPVQLQRSKAQLNRQVKAFVAAYYSVTYPQDATDSTQAFTLSAANSRKLVKPYATARFLETAPFGYELYGSTPATNDLVRGHAAITAEPLTGLAGEGYSPTKATGTVVVRFSKTDASGSVVLGNKVQTITLVRQGKTWLVDDAPFT